MTPATNAALARTDETPSTAEALVLLFERLAKDPAVDVDKLERLIAAQERILDRNAESAFNIAFTAMQTEIPAIDEKGQILNNQGKVQSTYSRFEDIQRVVKPILQRHGFALAFRTEWPSPAVPKVIGILTHRDGHKRESEFCAAADTSGNKNAVQGLGSSTSYGRRYTTIDLLNIETRGVDDDGRKSGKPPAPEGYDNWLADMETVAEEGTTKLQEQFTKSKTEFKRYATGPDVDRWNGVKRKAAKVSRG